MHTEMYVEDCVDDPCHRAFNMASNLLVISMSYSYVKAMSAVSNLQ